MSHGFYKTAATPFHEAFTGLEIIRNWSNKINHEYYLNFFFLLAFLFFWSPQSLQRSPISLQFIIYIVNMTVGVTGAVLYTIFSETNNSFGTEKKAFIAICYVAFECFMMLILFLLAAAQWHKYLRLWQEVIFNSFDMHYH